MEITDLKHIKKVLQERIMSMQTTEADDSHSAIILSEIEGKLSQPTKKITTAKQIIEDVDNKIETPFVTARFGNEWKANAETNYTKEDVVHIAWIQGRRSILLERVINTLTK